MHYYAVIDTQSKQVMAIDESKYPITSNCHIPLTSKLPVIGKIFTGKVDANGYADFDSFKEGVKTFLSTHKKVTQVGGEIEIRAKVENSTDHYYLTCIYNNNNIFFKTVKDELFIKHKFESPGIYRLLLLDVNASVKAQSTIIVEEQEDG